MCEQLVAVLGYPVIVDRYHRQCHVVDASKQILKQFGCRCCCNQHDGTLVFKLADHDIIFGLSSKQLSPTSGQMMLDPDPFTSVPYRGPITIYASAS